MGLFGRNRKNDGAGYGLIDDLSRLEVNTILKPEITGGRMPATRYALCNIASAYARKLIELGALTPGELSTDGRIPGGYETFRRIRQRAREAQLVIGDPSNGLSKDEAARYYMLNRIWSSCDDIKWLFRRCLEAKSLKYENKESFTEENRKKWDNPYTTAELYGMKIGGTGMDLDGRDLARLRKIWELGVEEIVIQTAIEVTGDVFTRVNPKVANEDYATLHRLHGESVHVSLRYWGSMIEIIAAFIGTFFKSLARRF